jgi:hypothetical protein
LQAVVVPAAAVITAHGVGGDYARLLLFWCCCIIFYFRRTKYLCADFTYIKSV